MYCIIQGEEKEEEEEEGGGVKSYLGNTHLHGSLFPNPGSTLLKDDFLPCWKVQLKHCQEQI